MALFMLLATFDTILLSTQFCIATILRTKQVVTCNKHDIRFIRHDKYYKIIYWRRHTNEILMTQQMDCIEITLLTDFETANGMFSVCVENTQPLTKQKRRNRNIF